MKAIRVPVPRETRGMLIGLGGVIAFSLTLPMTRISVTQLDPTWHALARAAGAGALAAIVLRITGQRRPAREHWPDLAAVIAGVVLGFPWLSSIAMRLTDASHGAVITGLLPLATVIAAASRSHERPSPRFWLAAVAGSAVVVAYALYHGDGRLTPGDLAMLGAVAAGAIGYAAGGRLARTLGGWQTISWALVGALPLLLPPLAWLTAAQDFSIVGARAWGGFAYVTVMSQFVGFFFWYGGMAIAGIARVSQVQLLQLFFTLVASAWLAGEQVDASTWIVALIVVALVAFGRRAPIRRQEQAA